MAQDGSTAPLMAVPWLRRPGRPNIARWAPMLGGLPIRAELASAAHAPALRLEAPLTSRRGGPMDGHGRIRHIEEGWPGHSVATCSPTRQKPLPEHKANRWQKSRGRTNCTGLLIRGPRVRVPPGSPRIFLEKIRISTGCVATDFMAALPPTVLGAFRRQAGAEPIAA